MKTNSKTLKAVCVALVVVLASSPAAVHAWGMPKFMRMDNTWPFRDKDKPQEGTPVRMVGAWTDTVMTQAGQKPQRGFGGRIMFYDKEGRSRFWSMASWWSTRSTKPAATRRTTSRHDVMFFRPIRWRFT